MTEFAHRLTLDRIRDGERLDLVADAAECAAIAERLDLSRSTGSKRMSRWPARAMRCAHRAGSRPR